jgi:bifunctional non-homologous end joining protein LigD
MKWDGIRALICIDEETVRIYTRNGMDITARFPELTEDVPLRSVSAVLDGEIVCLDEEGKPRFDLVLTRIQRKRKSDRSAPAHCYLFDCLYLDGRPIIGEPLVRRQAWLADSLKHQEGPYRLSRTIDDGKAFFDAVKGLGMEGIMAKRRGSRYAVGERTDAWLKIKVRSTADCVVIGYTEGEGKTRASFGALHLAEETTGGLVYRGRVGSGFTEKQRKDIRKALDTLPPLEASVRNKPSEKDGTWVAPGLTCEIKYNELTRGGVYRAPVFLRLRPDKSDAALATDHTLS